MFDCENQGTHLHIVFESPYIIAPLNHLYLNGFAP